MEKVLIKFSGLFLLLLLPLSLIHAEISDKTYIANSDEYDDVSYNNVTLNNNVILTIHEGAYYNVLIDFTANNNPTLLIKDGATMIVTGDFYVMNNLNIIVEDGANLIILGKLIAKNNSELTISGDISVNSIEVDQNAKFSILEGGSFNVEEDLIAGNNAYLTISADMNIDGNVTIGSGSIFVDSSGNLEIGGDFEGDVTVTGTGTVIVEGNTGDGVSIGGDIVQPITLSHFTAKINSGKTNFSWSTLSEQNFDHFSIERSSDAKNYASIGSIKGAGSSQTRKDYSFADNNPLPGMNYYRLKAVDLDGYTEYFAPVSVFNNDIQVFVNTLVRDKNLKIQGNINGSVQLISLNGLEVYKGLMVDGYNDITLPSSIIKGVYALVIHTENNVVKRMKVHIE